MSLQARVDSYLRRTGMPRTRFGRLTVHDPRLVDDLRNGRQPGPGVIARVEAFLVAHGEPRA